MKYEDIKPGDIVQYPSGGQDYIFKDEDGNLLVNACNKRWIDRGLRMYGEECYYFNRDDAEEVKVVDHFGEGNYEDGRRWYSEHQDAVPYANG